MKKIKKYISLGIMLSSFSVLPMIAGAAVGTFDELITLVQSTLGKIVPIIISIAVIVFLVGIIGYITAGQDEEKLAKSRNLMIYGIIGLFVMVSVWGFVKILTGTFGFGVITAPSTQGILPIK